MNARPLACVALILMLIALPAGPSLAQETEGQAINDKWAVVVGISKFNDESLNLKYAANDAKDFYKYLVNNGHFAPDHVTLLTDEQATRQNVLSTICERWLPTLVKPNDLVVIYYSSHGSPADNNVGGVNYILTHDASKDNLYGTGIAMQDLSKLIKDRIRTDKVLLVLDACHSGTISGDGKGISRETNLNAQAVAQDSGRMVIASSEPSQTSWESKDRPNGVFTYYLIEGLKQKGDQTKLDDAFKFMKEKVEEEVLQVRGAMQTPVMSGEGTLKTVALALPSASPRAVPPDLAPQRPAGIPDPNQAAVPAVAKPNIVIQSRLWESSLENGNKARREGHYAESEKLLSDAQKESERFSDRDPRVATTLNALGRLKTAQGKFADAEPLFRKALSIREKTGGPNNPDLAETLNDLSELLLAKGKFTEASALLKRALSIQEKTFGADSPKSGRSMNTLTKILLDEGKYGAAEDNANRTMSLLQKSAADSAEFATSLLLAGRLAMIDGRTNDAKKLLQRAMDLQEKLLGSEHPDLIDSINAMAELYTNQQKYNEAEPLLYKSLAIGEQTLGSDHPSVANCLDDLALISELKLKYPQAESSYKKALDIREKDLGAAHPAVGQSLMNLAWLKYAQEDYPQADSLFRKAQTVTEKALAPDNPKVITMLQYYGYLLGATSRKKQVTEVNARIKSLKAKNKQENPRAKGNVDERLLSLRVSALREFQKDEKKRR